MGAPRNQEDGQGSWTSSRVADHPAFRAKVERGPGHLGWWVTLTGVRWGVTLVRLGEAGKK